MVGRGECFHAVSHVLTKTLTLVPDLALSSHPRLCTSASSIRSETRRRSLERMIRDQDLPIAFSQWLDQMLLRRVRVQSSSRFFFLSVACYIPKSGRLKKDACLEDTHQHTIFLYFFSGGWKCFCDTLCLAPRIATKRRGRWWGRSCCSF